MLGVEVRGVLEEDILGAKNKGEATGSLYSMLKKSSTNLSQGRVSGSFTVD